MTAIRAVIKALRPSARRDLQRMMKPLVARGATRALLNALYRRMSFRQWRSFYWYYAWLFSPGELADPGIWTVDFAGRPVVLPLGRETFAFDWDRALAFLGHDAEVKETYARLIGSREPPDLLIDIGANFGLHTLMFLVHEIETVSFEPNGSCHAAMRALCRLNAVEPEIIAAAVSDVDGVATLSFPPGATWLGTIEEATAARIGAGQPLLSREVPQIRLDTLAAQLEGRRVLLKIDAEGAERRIIAGAAQVLRDIRPLVIFESTLEDRDRASLWAGLHQSGYEIHRLPWPTRQVQAAVTVEAFVGTREQNFIAIPVSAKP